MSELLIGPWPHFDEEMIEATARVLRSGKVNPWTGDETTQFEKEFTRWQGSTHGVALANGTVALEVALEALGVGNGDEVIVPPRTFLATASAVLRVGATPIFADVSPETGSLTAATIERALSARTRAIIPVHLGGFPAPMAEIMALARAREVFVVEDCAQAHGAVSDGRKIGTWGDVGAFSFCQDKILTTAGEGGFVVTEREDLYKSMWSIKDHGKGFDTVFHTKHPPGFRWLHEASGSNYRMSELHAAVGRIALRRLDEWLVQRRQNAARITSVLSKVPYLRVPAPPKNSSSAYYRLYAYVDLPNQRSRDSILERLEECGIPARTGSCSEVYRERLFQERGLMPAMPLPVAHELSKTAIEFPTHPGVTPVIDDLCSRIMTALHGPAD